MYGLAVMLDIATPKVHKWIQIAVFGKRNRQVETP
jgi:hypothetical protein